LAGGRREVCRSYIRPGCPRPDDRLMLYGLAAEAVVAFHFAFVLFVVPH
jgi:hypothetical protein